MAVDPFTAAQVGIGAGQFISSLVGARRRRREAEEEARRRQAALQSLGAEAAGTGRELEPFIMSRVRGELSPGLARQFEAGEALQRIQTGRSFASQQRAAEQQISRLGALGSPAAQARLGGLERARGREMSDHERSLIAQRGQRALALQGAGIGEGLNLASLRQASLQQRMAALLQE